MLEGWSDIEKKTLNKIKIVQLKRKPNLLLTAFLYEHIDKINIVTVCPKSRIQFYKGPHHLKKDKISLIYNRWPDLQLLIFYLW